MSAYTSANHRGVEPPSCVAQFTRHFEAHPVYHDRSPTLQKSQKGVQLVNSHTILISTIAMCRSFNYNQLHRASIVHGDEMQDASMMRREHMETLAETAMRLRLQEFYKELERERPRLPHETIVEARAAGIEARHRATVARIIAQKRRMRELQARWKEKDQERFAFIAALRQSNDRETWTRSDRRKSSNTGNG